MIKKINYQNCVKSLSPVDTFYFIADKIDEIIDKLNEKENQDLELKIKEESEIIDWLKSLEIKKPIDEKCSKMLLDYFETKNN
jgi:hypothetical protein